MEPAVATGTLGSMARMSASTYWLHGNQWRAFAIGHACPRAEQTGSSGVTQRSILVDT
jgi:hypothetical protein